MKRQTIRYAPERQSIRSGLLNPKEHDSSCVRSLSYDPERLQMTIEFQERGTYTYFDVEPWLFAEFNNSSKRGTYFNLYFRNAGYSYERVS